MYKMEKKEELNAFFFLLSNKLHGIYVTLSCYDPKAVGLINDWV